MTGHVGVASTGEEPTLRIDPGGTIQTANQAALELLGLGLDELRALPPGSLAAEPTDPDEQEALRAQWEATGRAALAGLTTIKRSDGRRIRVAFAIAPEPDGSFVATLNHAPGSKATTSRVYTMGDVLGRWRAAERELQAIDASSAEYASIQDEVAELRAQYQRLFEARARAS
jgi:PAS domain S-box-containing protein